MLDITHEEWLRRAKALDLSGLHHIDGADEGAEEVAAAVAAARRAFDSGPRPRLAPADRGRMLLRIADLLEKRRAELALTVSLEMGKPITNPYDIELRAVITTFRWYGQPADKLPDESLHTASDALAQVTPEPARRRCGRAVELPPDPGRREDSPGTRRGLRRRTEAVGELTPVGPAARAQDAAAVFAATGGLVTTRPWGHDGDPVERHTYERRG